MSVVGGRVVVVGGLEGVGREVDEADSGAWRWCLVTLHRCHDGLDGFEGWIVQSTEDTACFKEAGRREEKL